MPGRFYRQPTICRSCQAPRGQLVTRRISDPCVWALDTDLADEFPTIWGPPHRIILNADSRCETCSRPLGLGSTV